MSIFKTLVSFVLVSFVLWGCKDQTSKSTGSERGKTREELSNGLTPEQASKVVARVGDQTITVGDVTEQINRLSPYIKRRWATPEKRREFLQKLIQIELLSQEAIANGLDSSPEVQRAIKQVMVRLLVKNDLQKELFPASVDEARLQQEYEADWLKYHSPVQYRMGQIVVATEAEAKKLIADIQTSANPRARFRELARTVSIDEAGRNRAGDIGYVLNPADIEASRKNGANRVYEQQPGISDEVANAAWTLKEPNEVVSKPVKTELGYHVLMLSTVKPALNRSFSSVKRLIENRVLRDMKREKMDAYVASLRKDANIKIYAENLNKVALELSEYSRNDGTESLSAEEIPPTDLLNDDMDLVPGTVQSEKMGN